MADKLIQLRHDSRVNLSLLNPVLALAEVCYETEELYQKVGDGVTAWNDLPYELSRFDLDAHTNATGNVHSLTAAQVRSILGVSTLSGSNTGDQDLSTLVAKAGDQLTATLRSTEVTETPTGTTQTITLNNGNHQTLSLASTTGNPTITLTVPTSSAAGTLIVINHGTTPRSVTWAVSSGSILWEGGSAPSLSGDAVSSSRIITWRWNGSVMRLAATGVYS